MQLDDALIQIADIRQRMARAGTFRGYPSGPTAVSGGLALLAAAGQQRWIPVPKLAIDAYVELWGTVAIVSMVICGVAMLVRLWRLGSAVQRSLSVSAIQQIVPSLIAGAMVSSVILYVYPEILPGIWMMFFGLGLFASRPLLPRPIGWMGGYYLLAGMLALSGRVDPLQPWMMGLTFGVGQLAIAAMLYWTLERGESGGETSKMSRDNKPESRTEPVSPTPPLREPGQFAYGGLQRVIHERARLSILSSLAAHPEGLLFNDLKALCDLTDGNLSRQLTALQSAQLVEVWKGTKNRRPQTLCRLTPVGRKRFVEYIGELERVVHNAQSAGLDDAGASLHQRLGRLRPGTAGG